MLMLMVEMVGRVVMVMVMVVVMVRKVIKMLMDSQIFIYPYDVCYYLILF